MSKEAHRENALYGDSFSCIVCGSANEAGCTNSYFGRGGIYALPSDYNGVCFLILSGAFTGDLTVLGVEAKEEKGGSITCRM